MRTTEEIMMDHGEDPIPLGAGFDDQGPTIRGEVQFGLEGGYVDEIILDIRQQDPLAGAIPFGAGFDDQCDAITGGEVRLEQGTGAWIEVDKERLAQWEANSRAERFTEIVKSIGAGHEPGAVERKNAEAASRKAKSIPVTGAKVYVDGAYLGDAKSWDIVNDAEGEEPLSPEMEARISEWETATRKARLERANTAPLEWFDARRPPAPEPSPLDDTARYYAEAEARTQALFYARAAERGGGGKRAEKALTRARWRFIPSPKGGAPLTADVIEATLAMKAQAHGLAEKNVAVLEQRQAEARAALGIHAPEKLKEMDRAMSKMAKRRVRR